MIDKVYALWQGRKVLIRFDIPVLDVNPPEYTIEYTDDDGVVKLAGVSWDELDDLPDDA